MFLSPSYQMRFVEMLKEYALNLNFNVDECLYVVASNGFFLLFPFQLFLQAQECDYIYVA